MKKIVFVCSHLHSGSEALAAAMDANPRIQEYKMTGFSSPLHLVSLTEQPHKLKNRSAIYMQQLVHNHEMCTKIAYKECSFIYVVRSPEATLNMLISRSKMKPSFAQRYYTYRLRRLCEMAKRTPGAILLTWEDLKAGRGISMIEDYLNLKTPILFKPEHLTAEVFPTNLAGSLLAPTEEAWEKYLFFLKNQNIYFCS